MSQAEVLILGGGPAGISALLWCHSLHLRGRLLEQGQELGGQLLQMFHRLSDYPGLPGLTGIELRDRFVDHLGELVLDWQAGCRIEAVNLPERKVRLSGEEIAAEALILATGARKRTLGVPGEIRFAQRGVSYSGTRDHSAYAGREVCVVGGGDSAIENCLILSRVCPRVTLIHRSDRFRARQSWLRAAQQTPNLQFLPWTEVVAVEGSDEVESLLLQDRRTGVTSRYPTGALFVKIGVQPNTDLFADQLPLDPEGYLMVDNHQRTAIDQVYAVGDVTNPVCLSIATAVGHGAIAAKEIALRRLAGTSV
jgi:thioredoxin reductase (NADPH)